MPSRNSAFSPIPTRGPARAFLGKLFRRRHNPPPAPPMRLATEGARRTNADASLRPLKSEHRGQRRGARRRERPIHRDRCDSELEDNGRATVNARGPSLSRFNSARADVPRRFESLHEAAWRSRRERSAFECAAANLEHQRNDGFRKSPPTAAAAAQAPRGVRCRACAPRAWRREAVHHVLCPNRAVARRARTVGACLPTETPEGDANVARSDSAFRWPRRVLQPDSNDDDSGAADLFASRHVSWEGGARLSRMLSSRRTSKARCATRDSAPSPLTERTEDDLSFMRMHRLVRPIPAWSGAMLSGEMVDDVMSSVTRGSDSNDDR